MLVILLFFVELLILFLLSKSLTKQIFLLLLLLTRNRKIAIYSLALLFLPGTIIHELSHYIMAHLLLVHAGKIQVFPQIHGEEVKLGTVFIAKTDALRQFLIGAAPFFFGTTLIMLLIYTININNYSTNPYLVILVGYAVFQIGNSMFSSKKDMEGAFALLIVIALVLIGGFIAGIRVDLDYFSRFDYILEVFKTGSIYLSVPIIIDIIIISIILLLRRLLR